MVQHHVLPLAGYVLCLVLCCLQGGDEQYLYNLFRRYGMLGCVKITADSSPDQRSVAGVTYAPCHALPYLILISIMPTIKLFRV
jgi:hypothetical protein